MGHGASRFAEDRSSRPSELAGGVRRAEASVEFLAVPAILLHKSGQQIQHPTPRFLAGPVSTKTAIAGKPPVQRNPARDGMADFRNFWRSPWPTPPHEGRKRTWQAKFKFLCLVSFLATHCSMLAAVAFSGPPLAGHPADHGKGCS